MIKWLLSLFKPKKVAGASALTLAVALIIPWEGLQLKAYKDIVGVWTICYGHTQGVKPGQVMTKEDCDNQLAEEVKVYNDYLRSYVGRDMPVKVEAAFTSWIYNVGPGNAKTSTLVRYAKEGRWVDACNQLPRWNKAGGKTVRGLTNRRAAEQKLCLEDLQ